MPFAIIPSESKKRIDLAGDILIDNKSNSSDLYWAFDLANRWRACHAYPINTFQSTLRTKLKNGNYRNDYLVAQRLKRMSTIIDKLKRYPNMKLTTMQDIGGVRAVLSSINEVYKLSSAYKDNKRFKHDLFREYDYINEPRDEDGYRSLHLVYKYKNSLNPIYDGLRLEMQIRTKLQHTWATAVETMGTFLGQALKSRMGDKEWLEFFTLTSAVFAHIEKSSLVPRFANLSYEKTALALSEANEKLGALTMMRGFSVAIDHITTKQSGWSYHLIVLDSINRTVQIKPYNRDSLEIALKDLTKLEKEASDGRKIEPVLVSAGPIGALKRAYPNFFLDIQEFVKIVSKIIESVKS